MSYRDDLDAAHMRLEATSRENARLAEANVQLERELADAKTWLGGPRRRTIVTCAVGALALGMAVGGVLVGRSTVDCPVRVERAPEPALPLVFGTIVADGPAVGRWTLNASRCVSRSDGIELAEIGSEDHAIWLTNDTAEVEVPSGDFMLKKPMCYGRFVHEVGRREGKPPTFHGVVALDCQFDGNSLQGRIEFQNCR